jgi:hypothetical protein
MVPDRRALGEKPRLTVQLNVHRCICFDVGVPTLTHRFNPRAQRCRLSAKKRRAPSESLACIKVLVRSSLLVHGAVFYKLITKGRTDEWIYTLALRLHGFWCSYQYRSPLVAAAIGQSPSSCLVLFLQCSQGTTNFYATQI